MDLGFNPVPKPPKKEKKAYRGLQTKKPLQAKKQLETKSTLKAKPKAKVKLPKEKKKTKKKDHSKVLRDGLKIPSQATRSEFTDRERKLINESFGGAHCAECGNPYIHHHHAKFRSGSGRGVWRNGVPLCKVHHDLCHEERWYADKWRNFLLRKYGKYYYMDKYDLWMLNKIEAPTREAFEKFMLDEERSLLV